MKSPINPLQPLRGVEGGRAGRTTRLRYSHKNRSKVLYDSIKKHNEAMSGRGLKFLRSFLSRVVGFNRFEAAKPLLHAVNGINPVEAVGLAKSLVSQTHDTAAEHFAVKQIALSVAKYPFPGLPEVARANGLKTLIEGERRNRHMNALLRARRRTEFHDTWLHDVRSYVHQVLGDTPNFQKWTSFAGWGPGACVGVHGRFTHFAAKLLAEEWTCTRQALPYALTLAKRLPVFWELLGLTHNVESSWGDLFNPISTRYICVDTDEFTRRFLERVVFVEYNKVAFVRKDADKDRVIASEPLLNQLCQKAADEEMRLKLRRYGIDLRDQAPNQEMAREGSLGGSNPRCTVDITNASGSIFVELVREVTAYCPEWYHCLNDLRSKSYVMPEKDSQPKRYEMFSSMGNGTTFPLETLIFAAICSAAHKYCGTAPDFRCYGDDIIVRQNEALVVLEILRSYGFKANARKTFIHGPFRESCGSDWYDGVAVRPIVFDTSLDTLEERVRVHNALVRLPNAMDAQLLSGCCADWFPSSFSPSLVRPFADHTDEAIDGRFIHKVTCPSDEQCTTFASPSWYGQTFTPIGDEDIAGHPNYGVAYYYAGLLGASPDIPFAARRETRMRVARFSHSGNTSSWLPPPATQCNARVDEVRAFTHQVKATLAWQLSSVAAQLPLALGS